MRDHAFIVLILLLTGLLLSSGCSRQIEVPMFNYQACRQSMTRQLVEQGVEPVAANMQSMAYCREQQALAQKRE
ncbi:MAG: hypothetical protein PVI92_04170 [Chromatiales bacterium]|jgi:hypothetical protein